MPKPITVCGRPLAERYDMVLAHEHLFIDMRCWLDETHEPSRHVRESKVTRRRWPTSGATRRRAWTIWCSTMADRMTAEVAALGHLGASLLVDVTPVSVGRDSAALAQVSERTGVDVVSGCGRYTAESRIGDEHLTVSFYRDEILAEFDDPARRPAVIGEIGTGDPIAAMDRRALTGAAQAHAELGVPLYVHLHPWGRQGHAAPDIIDAAGGALDRAVLCHLDPAIGEGLDYHRGLMDRGATIAFDLWGNESAYGATSMPTDAQHPDTVAELVAQGYGDRLAHSHDVCTKTQLRGFGGAGFDHLPKAIGHA